MDLRTTTRSIQRLVGVPADGVYGPQTAGAILAALRMHVPAPPAGEPVPGPDLDPAFDSRTEKNLRTLQPGAQRDFRPFLRRAIAIAASMGATAKVICGDRNAADQAKAKASGASKASFGYSWHNYGMAIDLGLFRGSSYLDSDQPALAERIYAAIGAIAPDYGIEWSGSWRSFKDTPHFHIAGRPSTPTATDRSRLQAGTWSY